MAAFAEDTVGNGGCHDRGAPRGGSAQDGPRQPLSQPRGHRREPGFQAWSSRPPVRPHPQHSGSAPLAPGNQDLQQSAGRDGPGTRAKPGGGSPRDSGGEKKNRAGVGLGAGNSGTPAAPMPAAV